MGKEMSHATTIIKCNKIRVNYRAEEYNENSTGCKPYARWCFSFCTTFYVLFKTYFQNKICIYIVVT